MTATSARLALPLLEAGQAQKEMGHNEALALIDLAIGATVEAVGVDAPPSQPRSGQCWIVGASPAGAWAGKAGSIAGWTAGGWRFLPPAEGLSAWDRGTGALARRVGNAWRIEAPAAAIAGPAGGATVDAEARAAIAAMLAAMRLRGMIAT